MRWQCPECGPDVPYDDAVLCPRHFTELVPYQPTPVTVEENAEPAGPPPRPRTEEQPEAVRWDRSRCWHCDTRSPDPKNPECLRCRRSLTPPALLLSFQDNEIEVNAGTHVELGRIGEHGRVFRPFPNVSRRHAVVGVDPDGAPWIQPLPTPNGTFVNGTEIPASVRQLLRNGQRLRFALHAEGNVTIYAR